MLRPDCRLFTATADMLGKRAPPRARQRRRPATISYVHATRPEHAANTASTPRATRSPPFRGNLRPRWKPRRRPHGRTSSGGGGRGPPAPTPPRAWRRLTGAQRLQRAGPGDHLIDQRVHRFLVSGIGLEHG